MYVRERLKGRQIQCKIRKYTKCKYIQIGIPIWHLPHELNINLNTCMREQRPIWKYKWKTKQFLFKCNFEKNKVVKSFSSASAVFLYGVRKLWKRVIVNDCGWNSNTKILKFSFTQIYNFWSVPNLITISWHINITFLFGIEIA